MYRHNRSHAAGMRLRHLSLFPTHQPQLLQLHPLPHSMSPGLGCTWDAALWTQREMLKCWAVHPSQAPCLIFPKPRSYYVAHTRSGTAAYGHVALAYRVTWEQQWEAEARPTLVPSFSQWLHISPLFLLDSPPSKERRVKALPRTVRVFSKVHSFFYFRGCYFPCHSDLLRLPGHWTPYEGLRDFLLL